MRKFFTISRLLSCTFFLIFSLQLNAQVNIANGSTVTENFNTIGSSATAVLPVGWKVDKFNGARVLGTWAAALSNTDRFGGASLSGTASNGIYNYGAGTTTAGDADRAIGGLSSSSATGSANVYVDLFNSGANSIPTFSIAYDVEKYRTGTNANGFRIQMYYSTDGTSWTSAGSGFLTSFVADVANGGYANAPGVTVSVAATTLPVSIAPGTHLYLAWNYAVSAGSTTSNAQGLGVDNIKITAALSDNANLSGLVLSNGTLTPSFNGQLAYTASVGNSVSNLTVTPTAASGSTILVNGIAVASGNASAPIALNVGSNMINISVTAQDGVTQKTYTVNVTRSAPASPLFVQESSLAPFGNVCIGTTAGPNSFTIGGADLDGSAVSISSLTGFSFSENAGGPYSSTLSFSPGTSFSNKTLYVQFSPQAVQSYDGTIIISGGGAASVAIAAVGSGINTMATLTTGVHSGAGTSATLNGNITAAGCSAVSAYGFEYSTSPGFANGTGIQVTATTLNSGSFSQTISGLTGGTTYYYKAFAINAGGTAYGAENNFTASAVVPVVIAEQALFRYTESFSDIGSWTNNFVAGNGANRFSSVPVNTTGSIPSATRTTISSASFSSGTSGGVQKGSGNIYLLATGTADNSASVAMDFYMDFTGVNAGTLSFDWASVNNSTGNRNGSLRVYATVDGTVFTELTQASVLNITNNVPSLGTVNNIALPAIFNNSATARLRFYYYNGTGGTTGSRPKISIDNLTVTGVASTPCATPTAGASGLAFGAIAETSIQASFTAASPAPNEYLVIMSTNSSLTTNPIDGQSYSVGDNVGDGDVIAKGTATNFMATGLDGATTYYFFIFPVNSVCTGGPLYSVAHILTGNVTTMAGLPNCAAPADQPTNFVAGTTGTNAVQASFTAGSGNEYLVLQSASASFSGTLVDGQVYNAGDIIGNAKVIQRGAGTSFTASGLLPATQYHFFVFSLNSQACVNGPVYNTVAPLAGSQSTTPLPACAIPATQPANLSLNASNSSITGTFNAVTNSGYYYLVVRSSSSTLSATPADNTDYNIGDNLGGGMVIGNTSATSFNAVGLSASTQYHFFVFAMDKNCTGGTKYLTVTPLQADATTTNTPPNNYYFGTLHSHSDYSDGNKDRPGFTPADNYAYALGSRGMDFLGISEHNHYSNGDPGNYLANYQLGVSQAANFSAANPGFLALYGMEWGTISGGGHVIVYGDQLGELFGWESNVNGISGPNYDVYVPKGIYTGATGLFKVINDFVSKNAFASLAHPNNSDYNNLSNLPYDAQADDAISATAVASGPATTTNTTYSAPAASMYYLWYYQKLLSKGYHLGPTIDHDNHNTTFGRTTNARTAVIAPALTQSAIMKAVRDMHFYATEDYDTKVDFTINNRIMGSIFEDRNAPAIAVNIADATTDYSNAKIKIMFGVPGSGVLPVGLDSVIGSSLTFIDNNLPTNTTGYYYVDITLGTTRTVTSPIWYTRKCAITKEFSVTACNSYTWGSTTYTSSVTDTRVFTTPEGCDSTVTLHLTINQGPVSAVINAAGGTSGCPGTGVALTATIDEGGNGTIASYQWLFNGNAIAGANNAAYTALQSGVYSLQVTNTHNCTIASNAVTVTVGDIIPPVVQTQNLTVFLDASGQAVITAAQVDNGSADNCTIASKSLDRTHFSCADIGTHTVTLTVTDGSGNSSGGTATITVVDNAKPVVITQNITVVLGPGGTATILPSQIDNGSTDNCAVASLSLDKTSFSCANIGANTVTLTVSDASGNSDLKTATVTVQGITYVTNTSSGKNFCTIQSAINDPLTQAGHTLEVQPGTYNEQVLVNKSVTIKGVGLTQPVVSFTGTPTGKKTLFDISVANVTIENIHIKVDLTRFSSGIIASGSNISNLSIKRNKVEAYASSAAVSTGTYGDRNAVSVNYSGSTNYRIASGGVSNLAFSDNSITGTANDGFGSIARFFRSGISADEATGTFTNNTSQSINHDILLRFGNAGSITVSGNTFNGGGLELSDMNAGAGTLTVSGNTFQAAFANVAAPNTAVLRLKNNYHARTTTVANNVFADHEWALSMENYNAVNIHNNSFTPRAGSVLYRHITVNTKAITSGSASIVQKTIAASITGNTFQGSGATGGTALTFLNHDNDAASFGSFVIGLPGSENNFHAGIKTFISLDHQSGPSGSATFPNYPSVIGNGAAAVTTMAAWTTPLSAAHNNFDVGSGLQLPAAMPLSGLFSLEDKIQHKIDAGTLGFVTIKPGEDYVTVNSFLAPLTTAASVQRGIDAAANGFTVNVGAGIFINNSVVNKQVGIIGQGQGITTILPAVSNPDCGGAGGGSSLCAGSSNVFLVQANNVTISQMTIDGDNPALSSATMVDGADIDARNGIITDHASGQFNNLAVNHVTVKNVFLRGIYASSGGSFHFSDNTVTNVQGNSSSIALFNFGGAGSFTNNTVSHTNDAIASNWSKGSTYTGNHVTHSGSGIHTDNNGGQGGDADLIQNNVVSDSKTNGYGIWVFAPYRSVLVKENTVSNVDVGLTSAGQQAAVTPVFERNTVDGQNKENSTGVYVTTSLFGFGSSDVSAIFKNNFIRNNADGFYLESETGNTLQLIANNNSITANSNSNVTQANGAGGQGNFALNMECNWWGTASTAAIAAKINGAAVDYSPRLANGTDSDNAAPGFQPAAACTDPISNAEVGVVTNVHCFGAATGEATISFTNGAPAFSYTLNGGSSVQIDGSPFTITGLAAGAYTIVITDGDGNSVSAEFTITQPVAPISADFSFTPIQCNGGLSTQNLTIHGGTAPYNVFNQNGGAFVLGAAEGITYGGTEGNTYAANYTYTVTDAKGCQYVFTVNIPEPPALQISVSATDITCNGGSSTITLQASGGTAPYIGTGIFNVTAGTYSYTVTDANGCTASTQITPVVIPDMTAPTITAPGNIVTVTDAGVCSASAIVLGTPVTGDNCTVASVSHNAPAVFPVGVTVVTWTATDNSGNMSSATQTVTVNDTEKPKIKAPMAYSVPSAPGQCGAVIASLGTPITSDNCGVASVTNDHPSNFFPVGTTLVKWTVTDIHGNFTDTAKQWVTVIDNELPAITVANVSAPNDAGACTATVELATPVTSDNCGVASLTNDHPSSSFPVGVTAVHWTVTDVNGWSKTVTQTITVMDTEQPMISPVPDQSFCTNTGGNYTIPGLTASDNCGIASISYSITGATTRSGTGANASGSFGTGSSTITWTVTDVNGNTQTAVTNVTVHLIPSTTITVSAPDAFCNKLTLTASSAAGGATYNWLSGSTPFANTQQVSLGLLNGDGVYSVTVTTNGCTSAPASYHYQKQNLAGSYTILTYKDAKFGRYNKVATGSVGVMSGKGEAEFKSYSAVSGPGSFVKAPKIDRDGYGIVINSEVIGIANVSLPVMQYNTNSTHNLANYQAATQNATIAGNYKNLTVKKGVSVTVTGNTFGSIKLEEGASIRFTSAVLNIGDLVAEKGAKNHTYSFIKFAPATSVRIGSRVSLGSQVWVNPDNYKLTFFMGDMKSDEEKFTIKGGDTKLTANIYMPDGKLKVSASDGDDDRDVCDHRSHSASGCRHRNHDHNDCNHRAHNAGDCGDDVYMTGLFIVETLESKGNTVIWNSFDCGSTPTVLTGNMNAMQQVSGEKMAVSTSEETWKVTVMPNPSSTYFTLKFESKYETPLNLRIMDSRGRVIDARSRLGANSTIQVGHAYSSGTYFAEIMQGGSRKVVQLIKAKG